MKAIVLAESFHFIILHQALSAPVMSTDMSQVGVALIPSFNIFLFFHQVLSTTVMSTDVSQVGVALFPSFQHSLSF